MKPVVLDLELLEIDQMQPVREPLLGADRSLEPLQRVPQDDVLQPLSVQDCLLLLLRGDELLDRRLRERLPGSRVLRRLGYLRVVPSFEATNVGVEFIGVRWRSRKASTSGIETVGWAERNERREIIKSLRN